MSDQTSADDAAVDMSPAALAHLVSWARGQSAAIRSTANITALALAACALNIEALAEERVAAHELLDILGAPDTQAGLVSGRDLTLAERIQCVADGDVTHG